MKNQQSRELIAGVIVKGSGSATQMGFPTINLKTKNEIHLIHGVYACRVMIDEMTYDGVMHFGPRPVMNDTKPLLEVHIFNFSQKIYGKEVFVEVYDFIRETMNFKSLNDLIEQITNDCEQARIILAKEIEG